jgi:PAS domain S-box-containing protein
MQYHFIFEQATDAIMVTDFNGNFKDVNSSFCTLFGYAKEELLTQNISKLISAKQLNERPIRFDILASGHPVLSEREMVHRDGSIIHVEANAKKFSDDGILVIARDVTKRKLLERQLLDQKSLHQKKMIKAIVNAQEKERAELGRELHDNVNQLLATSKLYLHQSLVENNNRHEYIIKSEEYISSALEELRKISHALVGPTQDETIGLIDSIEKLITDISKVKELEISFHHPYYREEDTEVGLKLVIYRIIQEQLTNVLKHSSATKVEIALKKEVNYLVVSIQDDGKGFDTSAKKPGIGLSNIKNRAEIYNGIVQIISSPGKGCKMKIIFIEQQVERFDVINER